MPKWIRFDNGEFEVKIGDLIMGPDSIPPVVPENCWGHAFKSGEFDHMIIGGWCGDTLTSVRKKLKDDSVVAWRIVHNDIYIGPKSRLYNPSSYAEELPLP